MLSLTAFSYAAYSCLFIIITPLADYSACCVGVIGLGITRCCFDVICDAVSTCKVISIELSARGLRHIASIAPISHIERIARHLARRSAVTSST